MPSTHLQELIDALRIQTGKPPFRRAPDEAKREAETDGLIDKDYIDLLDAITSSRHNLLAGRSIRLLIPRMALSALPVAKILAAFSQTNSSFVRLCWSRYLCASVDAQILGLDGMDCLRSGYGVLFHFLQQEKSQKELSRLLYRITRQTDVTDFRSRELSKMLAKLGPNPGSVMALGELFDVLGGSVRFPAKENGLPGASGLTLASRVKMHEKVQRVLDVEWTRLLKKHVLSGESDGKEVPSNDLERQVIEHTAKERSFTTKRPRILPLDDADLHSRVALADVFKVKAALESDPLAALNGDIQRALAAHLITWDGLSHQDETFDCVERLDVPSRADQELFERNVLGPLLDLLLNSTPTFGFRVSRALARMFGRWSLREISGSYFQRLMRLIDDCFVAALTMDQDDPLVQLAVTEFYTVTGRALLRRSKLFGNGPSLAVPPSQQLINRLILSPSAVGVEAAGRVFSQLFPVYRVEHAVGMSTEEQAKKVVAERFETLAKDFVKCVAMPFAAEAFDDLLKISGGRQNLVEESGLDLRGDELGVVRSFAFVGYWKLWWEDKDEPLPEPLSPDQYVQDEILAAYIVWLTKVFPATAEVVCAMSSTLNALITRSSTMTADF